jgi:hypothetical protein
MGTLHEWNSCLLDFFQRRSFRADRLPKHFARSVASLYYQRDKHWSMWWMDGGKT